MYGEMHILTGMTICAGAMHIDPSKWWASIPLAILSHWPLDDLNVGSLARLWHGTNPTQWMVRAILILGIIFFSTEYWWEMPVVGLIAWLSFDHEWIVGWIIRRHGYGLHSHMWMSWMYGKLGFWPFALACLLFFLLLL